MTHPAMIPGATAIVTGGAAGIGLAAARRFAGFGMNVCWRISARAGSRSPREAVRAATAGGGRRACLRRVRPERPSKRCARGWTTDFGGADPGDEQRRDPAGRDAVRARRRAGRRISR